MVLGAGITVSVLPRRRVRPVGVRVAVVPILHLLPEPVLQREHRGDRRDDLPYTIR